MGGWVGGWVAGWVGGWVAGWLGGWVGGSGGWVMPQLNLVFPPLESAWTKKKELENHTVN